MLRLRSTTIGTSTETLDGQVTGNHYIQRMGLFRGGEERILDKHHYTLTHAAVAEALCSFVVEGINLEDQYNVRFAREAAHLSLDGHSTESLLLTRSTPRDNANPQQWEINGKDGVQAVWSYLNSLGKEGITTPTEPCELHTYRFLSPGENPSIPTSPKNGLLVRYYGIPELPQLYQKV